MDNIECRNYFINLILNQRKNFYEKEIKKLFTFPYIMYNQLRYRIERIVEEDLNNNFDKILIPKKESYIVIFIVDKLENEFLKIEKLGHHKIYMLKEKNFNISKFKEKEDIFFDFTDYIINIMYFLFKEANFNFENFIINKIVEIFENQKFVHKKQLNEYLFEKVSLKLKIKSTFLEKEIEKIIQKYLKTDIHSDFYEADTIIKRKIKFKKIC